jgi:hypothetical protein
VRVEGWKRLDPAGAPLAASALEEKNPALASHSRASLLGVYERHDKDGTVAPDGKVLEDSGEKK